MFSKLILAASAALLAVSPVLATNANCTRTYTIVEGDICDGISRSQGVSTFQLAAVNYEVIDALCSNLQIGDELCLGTPGQDCKKLHFVEANDACDSIQTKYNVTSTTLKQNNPNINEACDNLYTGLALCVADTVIAPPVPPGFFNNNSTGAIDWIAVPEDQVQPGEQLPFCDEVGYNP